MEIVRVDEPIFLRAYTVQSALHTIVGGRLGACVCSSIVNDKRIRTLDIPLAVDVKMSAVFRQSLGLLVSAVAAAIGSE